MVLKISHTQISYINNPKPILDVDFAEFGSSINFLVGKNGSGKSTLLRALSSHNDEVVVKGNIELEGKPLQNFDIGLVAQIPQKSVNLELTFIENLLLAKTNGIEHISLGTQTNKSNIEIVLKFLKGFKNWDFLSELCYKETADLSSGQQQLLAILMRVIRFQNLLLLDECTANLDSENTNIILGILEELVKKGTIVLFATHQMELLKTNYSKTFLIENGKIKIQNQNN